ncbi:ABC transporter ATP-binding protein [Leucothrix pacifica]|uniref:ABC transporter ATP-binding protein n=1 Tax=Leucothrix pacifica TaxID=1247513 RepID=A0A317CF69_9GAMM|nr:dipeptide ABC transporter ATP-binding protein [Leucothrix pacifica]PWQ97047.1 ABC transporter ATP-binding protein [Leucothrix pacifica]
MSLLEVSDLHTHLNSGGKTVKAVDGVSFKIAKGETFCLVGESGSGKSICALSVMQLLPAGIASHPSGSIQFDWRNDAGSVEQVDLLSLAEPSMRKIRGARIAMIFQEPMTSLNPVFSIGEQIVEALQLHNTGLSDTEARQQAIEALEQVQIKSPESRIDDYPHMLSGGQRQRVMIAMALACKPDLLIADEPTTALDVTVQAEILELMRELQLDKGMALLFITHDFGVVAQMAHRVGVMQYGKLVEEGTTKEVLANPQHPYTQQLLASVPENLKRPDSVIAGSGSISNKPASEQYNSSGLDIDAVSPVSSDVAASLVEVRDLNVWFPIKKGLFRRVVDHVKAVDGIDLDIRKGSIMALVGESGCGKTTLGRAILQLEKPTSGSVKLTGQELTGLSAEALRPVRPRMQIAFQDPHSSLNPRLKVMTTLTEPMAAHGIGESREDRIERAAKVLEQVQLSADHLWRYPHEFSGGQRQRIGLARALVLNPEFIVCDEITSALDVSVQAEVLQLLLEIRQQRDLTLLFITHNIAVVEYLSDEVVVMKAGKIVEQGSTADVCQNPHQTYTKQLLDAVPRLNLSKIL